MRPEEERLEDAEDDDELESDDDEDEEDELEEDAGFTFFAEKSKTIFFWTES